MDTYRANEAGSFMSIDGKTASILLQRGPLSIHHLVLTWF